MRGPVLSQRERSEIPAGTRFGRYTIIRRLAMGGMAEVYLGRVDGIRGFRRAVALKLVLPHLAGDEKFIALFEHEAKIAAHLDHPNIIQIYELGRERADTFIAMEYVHGHTLRSVLACANGPLPLPCALVILMAICRALHHAHTAVDAEGIAMGIVHRDVSPSNIMIRPDGQVKVVDFGIAKAMAQTSMTATGTVKGKAGYMSPEQCRGDGLDHRSDIFNLGILLYETTTGRRAFGGTNVFEVMSRINEGRYMSPAEVVEGYPPALRQVIDGTLSTDPAGRPSSAHVLHQQIETFARAHDIQPSELVLAEWMTAHVPPPPALDLDAPHASGAAPRGRRWGRVGGLGAAGLVTVAAGFYGISAFIARDSSVAQEAPTAASRPSETSSPTLAVEGATSGSPPESDPESDPATTNIDGTTTADPTELGATGTEPVGTSRSRSKKRGRRSSPRKAAPASKRDPLFPWMGEG